MIEPFLGSEALSSGAVTPYQLRSQYVALHKDVYVAGNQELTASLRAKALWLRSRRRGVLAGYAAAVLHGARWIGGDKPVAIIDTNHRQAPGVQVWRDRIEADEIGVIDGMRVTTPDRTALDLASRYPLVTAVAAVDALMQATQVKVADVNLLAERYRGRRGIKSARAVLNLVDGGAQSPKETWLRLLLIRAGFPRPQTQIAVRNQWGWAEAYLDMGWEDIKVAAEYDGDHHLADRYHIKKDIRRHEKLTHHYGWIVVRVVAGDHQADIIRRVRDARASRGA
ncbi:hypothetical protein MKUB_21340 [Mycobacterium kubicae]|uniref:AbiEi antitoxin C-terminal domain-containing protein n=1 Tax=Mycobacterium kubicae TaxID=120959 RepID=A0AAX1JHD3_9MYCO|nr:hypothetical protein [Mycobacterium kubicae]MCV7095541.1 hypothetical protein [Mycobacterium kubicae]ORV94182.1 hypothetical protein AWC13_23385 [Mycobacterium kubicae]QNI11747.1 hypothetical protein GAN18_11440 [Mycobacterium kubicae]QPI39970.1 hypothetical protein I2456_11295 [Mycobacterium kubicae]GFG64644.1 hypothetical protein MKUB_21340 [Mycobacterium kubicae]